MFGTLTNKLHDAFRKLSGQATLTESNIADAVGEVRLALLEADVNYRVTKTLIQRIKEKAMGSEVLKSISPREQFIKIVHDELVTLMGSDESALKLQGNPAIIMMCGLQGSGKTTHSAKIARYARKEGLCKRPLLVACDLQRPAAVTQLLTLAKQAEIEAFSLEGETNPLVVAKQCLQEARKRMCDLIIVDTAGRLHVDEELMKELEALRDLLNPAEVLFVANATTGQDAVNVATQFSQRIGVTGSILTMLDGNARAGAAISIREVTGRPLKFEGVGERIEDLQLFNPKSMADRILGMGDTINLVKKMQEHFDEDEAKAAEEKLKKATFTYQDCLMQIQRLKKMGPLSGLLKMIPGVQSMMGGMDVDTKNLDKIEAIINSMTREEREGECELIPSRKRRLAQGSGTDIEEVNRLIKLFKNLKTMMKRMPTDKRALSKLLGG